MKNSAGPASFGSDRKASRSQMPLLDSSPDPRRDRHAAVRVVVQKVSAISTSRAQARQAERSPWTDGSLRAFRVGHRMSSEGPSEKLSIDWTTLHPSRTRWMNRARGKNAPVPQQSRYLRDSNRPIAGGRFDSTRAGSALLRSKRETRLHRRYGCAAILARGPQGFRKRSLTAPSLQDVAKKNGVTRGPKGGVSGKRPRKVTGSRVRRPNDEDRVWGTTHGAVVKACGSFNLRIPFQSRLLHFATFPYGAHCVEKLDHPVRSFCCTRGYREDQSPRRSTQVSGGCLKRV